MEPLKKRICILLVCLLISTICHTKNDYDTDLAIKSRQLNSQQIPSLASGPIQLIGHQAQTILLIMILSGVDLVRSHYENAKLLQNDIDKKELQENIITAAELIVNSGEIWSSMMGAAATTPINIASMHLIRSILGDSESKLIFKRLIASGMGTLITFIGWEIGGQLFNEAAMSFEDEEDFQKVESLGHLIRDAHKDGFSPDSKNTQLLKQLIGSMKNILFKDADLRSKLLYNAWRHRIATGEFVTLVTAMATASTLGSALFPGAGTIVGIMFGLTGGVIAILAPEEFTSTLTSYLKEARRLFWNSFHDNTDDTEFGFQVRKKIMKIVSDTITKNKPMPPALIFPNNSTAKNKIMTTYFEELWGLYQKILMLKHKINVAIEVRNFKSVIANEKDLESKKQHYHMLLEKMTRFYQKEYEYLLNGIKTHSLIRYNNEEMYKKYPILQDIFRAYYNTENMLITLSELKTALSQVDDISDNDLNILIHFYTEGYDENQ